MREIHLRIIEFNYRKTPLLITAFSEMHAFSKACTSLKAKFLLDKASSKL